MAAKKPEKEKTVAEQLHDMKTKGNLQVMPDTGREVALRTVEPRELLTDGKLPDILTPLVVKSVYQDLPDRELRDFLNSQKGSAEDALKMLDAIDYIAGKAIADGTKVQELTLGEKRWIFRLVMGPAELLIQFRYESEPDVEPVAEGEDVSPSS